MVTFCSTTGKTYINEKLLTLTKAINLIFYDSKIHVFFHVEEPPEQDWQQLGYCGLTRMFWETNQLCSEQGRPLGPPLGAVTWSYLCPGGYQNSMTVFKTAEQRQQYEPSLQVGFKSYLVSTIIIMLVDRVYTSWRTCADSIFKGGFAMLCSASLSKKCCTFPIQVYR